MGPHVSLGNKKSSLQRRQQSVQGERPTGDNWSYNSYKWPKINGFSWGYFTLLLVPPSTANQFVSHPVMPPPTVGGGWEYYWPLFIVVQPTISSTGTLLVLLDTTCTTWYYMCVCVCLYATILYATWEKGNQEPAGLVLSLVCLSFLGRPHGWIPRFYRDHCTTNPNNALSQGKSLKTTIHLHCLIPPKCVI